MLTEQEIQDRLNITKGNIIQDFIPIVNDIEKAAFPIGTVREWSGQRYKKTEHNKWEPVGEPGEVTSATNVLQTIINSEKPKSTKIKALLQLGLDNKHEIALVTGLW